MPHAKRINSPHQHQHVSVGFRCPFLLRSSVAQIRSDLLCSARLCCVMDALSLPPCFVGSAHKTSASRSVSHPSNQRRDQCHRSFPPLPSGHMFTLRPCSPVQPPASVAILPLPPTHILRRFEIRSVGRSVKIGASIVHFLNRSHPINSNRCLVELGTPSELQPKTVLAPIQPLSHQRPPF